MKGVAGNIEAAAEEIERFRMALKAVEWRGHQGKCPLCAGWNMSSFGETPGKHTKDCLVGRALAVTNGVGK